MPHEVQKETFLDAVALGGPESLTGRFLLAESVQVGSAEWWKSLQDDSTTVIVNCIGDMKEFQVRNLYPEPIAAKSQILRFGPRSEYRAEDFEVVWPVVGASLKKGQTVVVHCRQSFHRGPLVLACLMQKLCKVSYQVECAMQNHPMIRAWCVWRLVQSCWCSSNTSSMSIDSELLWGGDWGVLSMCLFSFRP